MGKVVERIVNAERVEDLITVFGSFDENIKRIEEALNVRVVNRGTDLRVSGDEEMADKAVRTLEGLLSLAAKGETIDELALGETKTVTLATQNDVVTAPIVGAGEFSDGKLYWRTTADNGETYEWLLDTAGEMMPVGGVPPTMGIDAEGFWTVNGERFTGKDGKPVLADDVSNTLFQKVETDEESGRVRFTLADGSSFEIPVFEALSITFDAAPVTAIPDRSAPAYIKYTVSGTEAEEAYVDYFTAWNVTVEIDKYTRTISVKLDEGAEEGNTVILVSAGGNTVLKPLFFTYGTAQIAPPTWDPQFGTGTEVALEGEFTEFDIKVSADIAYDVTIAEECRSWLKPAPATRAPMVTTTHSFVAD